MPYEVRYKAELTAAMIRAGQGTTSRRSRYCPVSRAIAASLPAGEYAECSSFGGMAWRRDDDGAAVIAGTLVLSENIRA